ncbi:hypothetical protein CPS_1613 [Colwellia psychrerythraea 34H]|uniref:Uncharacterized protein n=1 Tax=Colwellia psychrerythraea (strain 34H / ATCC BAA-681) TaxID=167879 RepID=Q485B4_COLP3|nr:hypothetical protein CPS_1613 [Colwellia psychrerythraea 34H]
MYFKEFWYEAFSASLSAIFTGEDNNFLIRE